MPGFSLKFLDLLRADKRLSEDVKNDVFEQILTAFAATFSMHMLFKDVSFMASIGSDVWRQCAQRPMMEALARILHYSMSLGFASLGCKILEQIKRDLDTVNVNAFTFTLFPFMKQILDVARTYQCYYYSDLFCGIIETHLRRVVGKKPLPPNDWSLNPVPCECTICEDLNSFLQCLVLKEARFDKYPLMPRKHLHKHLEGRDVYCEIDRKQSPHGLILHKSMGFWKHRTRDWKDNAEGLCKSIELLGERGLLEDFLGKPLSDLVDMEQLRASVVQLDIEDPTSRFPVKIVFPDARPQATTKRQPLQNLQHERNVSITHNKANKKPRLK